MPFYKYMDFKGFFDNFMIRFTQPMDLNDKRECRPILEIANPDSYIQAMETRQRAEYTQALGQIYSHLTPSQLAKVIDQAVAVQRRDFSENREQWIQKFRDIFMKNVNRYIGVLSLTTKTNDPKMWWDYGNKNTGFLIGFKDGSQFLTRRDNDNPMCGELLPVQYDNNRPTVLVHPGRLEIPRELFWWKTKEWESEREFRMIRNLQSADRTIDGRYFLWQLRTGDLDAVFFGSAVSDSEVAARNAQIKAFDPSISVYRMSVNGDGDFVPTLV